MPGTNAAISNLKSHIRMKNPVSNDGARILSSSTTDSTDKTGNRTSASSAKSAVQSSERGLQTASALRRQWAGLWSRTRWFIRTLNRHKCRAPYESLVSVTVVLAVLWMATGLVPTARALIKEPDNLVWGSIVLGTNTVTAAQTNIVVEARRSLSTAPLASYRMGSSAGGGSFYSLAIPLESVIPIGDPGAARTGEQILVLVHNGQFVRYLTLFNVGARGQIIRLDLGDVDSDNNGLVDNWERQYFGAAGQNPNGDPDRDGVGNRDEMLAGTHPQVPDARHPADVNPTNNVVSVHEVTAYASAWKAGKAWPVAPTNIPVDFVARAGFLWKNGERYIMNTNALALGAPLWWTNAPPDRTNIAPAQAVASSDLSRSVAKKSSASPGRDKSAAPTDASRITRSLSAAEPRGTELAVTLFVSPAEKVSAYVVEEKVPQGRTVGEVSDDGAFDSSASKVRWGPFFDHQSRELKYRLLSESATPSFGRFAGIASFDGWNVEAIGPDAVVPLAQMRWDTPRITQDGSLTLSLKGEPGQRYVVEVSTDLMNWKEVTKVTAEADGALHHSERIESSRSQQFFRARRLDE